MTTTTQIKELRYWSDLEMADQGSFYTIVGTGGELQEWIDGYEKLLDEAGIGKPVAWYSTTGAAVNYYAQPADPRHAFQLDLTFLMFPLEGLDIGRLAMFKLQAGDRWFDDIVANMRPDEEDDES